MTNRTTFAAAGVHRETKRVLHALVVTAAVAGMSLATSGPAEAGTEAGSWSPYRDKNPITSSSSTWKCGSTQTVTANVFAQACAIRSPGRGSVQAAVVVRNNRPSLYSVEAAVELIRATPGIHIPERWECARSGVGANSWSVCFGKTLAISDPVMVPQGGANGVLLPQSPEV